MLKEEIIESNYLTYIKFCKACNFYSESFFGELGEKLKKSPYSIYNNKVGCYKGGLIDLSLKIALIALELGKIKLNKENDFSKNYNLDRDKIIKIAFLSQIGKTDLFIENNNLKEKYSFNDLLLPLKTSERSILYCNKFNIKLEEDEFQAILNLDKDSQDLQSKFFTKPLGFILKEAVNIVEFTERN